MSHGHHNLAKKCCNSDRWFRVAACSESFPVLDSVIYKLYSLFLCIFWVHQMSFLQKMKIYFSCKMMCAFLQAS